MFVWVLHSFMLNWTRLPGDTDSGKTACICVLMTASIVHARKKNVYKTYQVIDHKISIRALFVNYAKAWIMLKI